MSGTYLDRIVADVTRRLDERRRRRPLAHLRTLPAPPGRPSFAEAIKAPGVSLIAEVKRASPSKGAIRPDLDAAQIAAAYERAGARAVSVLTEQDHFRGGLVDLEAVVAATGLPVLRKDFIVDEYQIEEARVAGASAVLLIAALLPDPLLGTLVDSAERAGLEVLLEIHDYAELQRALEHPAVVIGINNRDLRTFEVRLETSIDLARSVPPGRLLVSESGIGGPADVERLAAHGIDGVLVGESILRQGDVSQAVRALIGGMDAPVKGRRHGASGDGRATR